MNQQLKYRVVKYYCIIFYLLMLYKYSNGLFLYQLQPSFFYTREDIFTWLFMQTGLHQWLLNNPDGWLLFDFLFYSAPLFFFVHYRYNPANTTVAAIVLGVINWCYVQCYTLYPSNSIEGHIAWLLFPVIFMVNNPTTFALLLEALRYFFLFLFASSGVWKLMQGGLFNPLQMSGILLYQHKELLSNSPGYWQTRLVIALIKHPAVGYLLYLAAALTELSFITGFFTKRFDKYLALLFIIFLLLDHLIMRIPYYEISALTLTLLIRPKKIDQAILFV